MTKYIMDIEANHLLADVSKVWCVVLRNGDTNEVHTFDPDEIEASLEFMDKAEYLVGHNIIDYDLRVLKKLYGWDYKGKVIDTLVCTRTIWPHIGELDSKSKNLPQKLRGSHSLKAWGYRLGELKGEFNNGGESFETYTPEMLDYCIQDTAVTLKLYNAIYKKNFSNDALGLEHRLHTLLVRQQEAGFPFHVEKAQKLHATLEGRRSEIHTQLVDTFEPTIIEMKTKTKVLPFNPASRQQIADRLMKRGWVPTSFTPTNEPKVDEKILKEIDIQEAQLVSEYLMLNKRIGQLATGNQAWLKLEKDGRIHGRVNHMGAVTSRCTANNPNMQQVPSLSAPYGKECRELFYAPDGYSLLGADASSLELRCLAHYMAKYDDGAYAQEVVNGDVHSKTQELAGLPTRNNAKTFIYGFLYGSGDEKTGQIIGKGATEGKKIKAKFLRKLPALKKLRDDAATAAKERGWVKGLDGRIIPVRHAHACLNTILQSAGAIICKRWYVTIEELLRLNGYTSVDVTVVAFIHDEVQLLVRKGLEDEVGKLIQQAMKDTEAYYKFRCTLDSEYNYGNDWSSTH